MIISTIIVKLLGGFWKVKKNAQKPGFIGKIFSLIYNYHLSIQCSYIGKNSIFTGPSIFPHGIKSIFISGEASIGKNVIIYQQVTIGSNTLPDSKTMGAPIIGDNVLIGAGAKIIGNVKVGNNCRIGANAVVTEDIPDNAVVVMPKPRIIIKENLMNRFYTKYNGVWGYYEDAKFIIEKDLQVIQSLTKD